MARKGLFKRRKAARAEAALLSFKLGYINLMITLVPFLLSIAVFSRLAILELHLPKLSAPMENVSLQTPEPPPSSRFALTVAIEEEGVAVSNGSERLAFYPSREGRAPTDELSALMQKLKKEHPSEQEVVILSRPKTAYEDLVSIMDACRLAKIEEGGSKTAVSLFPHVALGEVSS